MKNLFKLFGSLGLLIALSSYIRAQTYCDPVYTYPAQYTTSFSTTQAEQNIGYTASTAPANNYVDRTATDTLKVKRGLWADFSHSYSTGQNSGLRIWVDWNNDGTFSDGELVSAGSSTDATPIVSNIAVPLNTPLGTYRVRVRSIWTNNPAYVFGPCEEIARGSVLDFSLEVLEKPSCTYVDNIIITAKTATSATIVWSSQNTTLEPEWQVAWGLAGYTVGTDDIGNLLTTSPTAVIPLAANTDYDVYVRAICASGDTSLWISASIISGGYCPPVYTFGCSNGARLGSVVTTGGLSNLSNITGTNCATNSYEDFTSMSATGYGGMTINMTVGVASYISGVKAWVDWNNNSVFEDNELVLASPTTITGGSSYSGTFTFPINQPVGNYRMRVRVVESTTIFTACSSQGYGETEDYTIAVVSSPSCLPVKNLASGVTFNSATVTWQAQNTTAETEWQVSYGAAGYTPGDSDEIGSSLETTTTKTINGLNPNTNYDIYVRAICGVGDTSDWLSIAIFTGYCTPQGLVTSQSYYVSAFSTTGALVDLNYTATSAVGYVDYTNNPFSVVSGQSLGWSMSASLSTNYFYVYIDLDQNMKFDPSDLIYASTAFESSPLTQTIVVDPLLPLGSYRVRVYSISSSVATLPCGSNTYGNYVDFTMNIVAPPSCMPISALSVINATGTTANIDWTAGASETTWDIQWGTGNFDPNTNTGTPTGTEMGWSSTTYSIAGLAPNTNYSIFVRANCGSGDESLWNQVSIYTGYCTPAGLTTSQTYYVSDFHTSGPGSVTNPAYSASTAVGYVDATSTPFVVLPGVPFNWSISATTATSTDYFYIVVDWNNDLIFDPSEMLYASTGYEASPKTGTYVIDPSQITPGDYRMRVYNAYLSGALITACGPNGYGNYVDFTLTVDPQPTCMPITDLTVDVASATTATFSWASQNTTAETEWQVSWGAPGYTPGDSDEIGTGTETSPTSLVTGLTADTQYEFYVRAVCGAGDTSLWIGRPFQTGYCTPTGLTTSSNYYVSKFSTTGAVTNLNYTASSGVGYVDQTSTPLVARIGEPIFWSISASQLANGFFIAVDWNNNFEFEPSEFVFSTTAFLPSPTTGTLVIDASQPTGDYRMRVYNAGSAIPTTTICGPNTYGNYVDFTLTVLPAPTCLPVVNFTLDNMSFSGIDVSWSAQNTTAETEWQLSWGDAGYTPGDSDELGSNFETTPTGTITGLTIETNYDLYVRAVCGAGDTSIWIPMSILYGYCPPTYTNGCSNGAKISNVITTTSSSISNLNNNTGSDCSGDAYNNFTAMNVTVIPGDVINTTVSLASWGAYIKAWVDWNNNMEFEESELVLISPSSVSSGSSYAQSFTVPTGQPQGSYRLRIRAVETDDTFTACSSQGYGEAEDYTIVVVAPPTCFPVTNLSVGNISGTDATVSWASQNTTAETEWQLSWGAAGYTPGDSDELGSNFETAPTGTITGLTAGASYDIYVRAICGAGDTSVWVSIPFVYAYCVPSYVNGCDNGAKVANVSLTGATVLNLNNDTGSAACGAGGYNDFTAMNAIVVPSDVLNMSVGVGSYGAGVKVWVDWNGNMTFEDSELVLASPSTILSGNAYSSSFTVSTGQAPGNYRMRVRVVEGLTAFTACSGQSYGEVEDYTVVVIATPTCFPVVNLSVGNISATGATVSWASQNTTAETEWQVSWGTPGYTPGDSDEIGSSFETTSTKTISGLTADTYYDVYVRAVCGAGDSSLWVSIPIYTGHCVPASTSTTLYYTKEFSTTNAITNINYSSVGLQAQGYDNKYATHTISQLAGSEFNFTHTYVGGNQVLRIWVDWNNDYVFSDNEEVFYDFSIPLIQNGKIIVPAGTPLGDYRMRMRSHFGTGTLNPEACGIHQYASTVDYKLSVVLPPSCYPVNNLAITGKTATSATVVWNTQNGTVEGSWFVSWGSVGYTPGDSDEIGTAVVTDSTISISNLTIDTNYDIYVRAICGANDSSEWTSISLFTGYCTPNATFTGDYLSEFKVTEALSADVSYAASSQTGIQGYNNLSANPTYQISQISNGSFDFKTTYVGGSNVVQIWIDWNSDLEFTDNERVFISNPEAGLATQLGTITIPAGTVPNSYRMRVRAVYRITGATNPLPTPCSTEFYGQVLDLTLHVVSCEVGAGTISGGDEVCLLGSLPLSSSETEGTPTWSSNDVNIATVDPTSGVVTGISPGSAIITYTLLAPNGCLDSTTHNVTVIAPYTVSITNAPDTLSVDDTHTYTSSGTAGTWSSSNAGVAEINASTGVLTAMSPGTVDITYVETSVCVIADIKPLVVKASQTTPPPPPPPGNGGGNTGVEEIGVLSSVTLFPNPTAQRVSLEFTLHHATNINVELLDMNGKMLTNYPIDNASTGTNVLNMDVSTLANGIYSVVIRSNDSLITKKLVITK